VRRPQPSLRNRFVVAYALLASLACAAGFLAYAAWGKGGGTTTSAARASAAHVSKAASKPTVVSRACQQDSIRQLACNEVLTYLRATDLDQAKTACAQLSKRSPLRKTCEARMRDGKGQRIKYGILDARTSSKGVAVLVALGPPQGRFVILLVPEGGQLRVLDIQPA
jgi:hypothetical protein